jgi:glyoxylase I family protein
MPDERGAGPRLSLWRDADAEAWTMRGSIHHLDLTVSDMAASAPFYEAVLGFLGYRRVREKPDGIDWDLDAPGAHCSIGIKPARATRRHDRYTPGLHHLAWRAESRDDVDRLHRLLLDLPAEVLDAPAEYPRYGAGYYAVFFADPDGMKLEFVHVPPAALARERQSATKQEHARRGA